MSWTNQTQPHSTQGKPPPAYGPTNPTTLMLASAGGALTASIVMILTLSPCEHDHSAPIDGSGVTNMEGTR